MILARTFALAAAVFIPMFNSMPHDLGDREIPVRVHLCDGSTATIDSKMLYSIERDAVQIFLKRENPPDLVLGLAIDSVSDMRRDLDGKLESYQERIFIELWRDKAEITWYKDRGKTKGTERLSAAESSKLVLDLEKLELDQLSFLSPIRSTRSGEEQVVGGTAAVFLRMNSRQGYRIYMNNVPSRGDQNYSESDSIWRYTKLLETVHNIRRQRSVNTP